VDQVCRRNLQHSMNIIPIPGAVDGNAAAWPCKRLYLCSNGSAGLRGGRRLRNGPSRERPRLADEDEVALAASTTKTDPQYTIRCGDVITGLDELAVAGRTPAHPCLGVCRWRPVRLPVVVGARRIALGTSLQLACRAFWSRHTRSGWRAA